MGRTLVIGDILPRALREEGLEKPILEVQLIDRWPEIMGPAIARMTRDVSVENGVLHLKVTNAALRSQLFEQRHELIAKVNNALGAHVLNDVHLS